MDAEIISIGTELLLGEIADTNAHYLANHLPLIGINLRWVTIVGDSRERLTEALQRAWGRSDIILATGGLGPTEDDITREAIAAILEEQPEVSPILEQELRSFFAFMGREMSPHNIKQATLIPSAQSIPNPRGTAPGWWIDKGKRIIVAMPGPPREMQHMWEKEVMPRLQQKCQKEFILSRTLKSFGLSEAGIDEAVSPLLPLDNTELGIYAKPDGIQIRLIARAPERSEAEKIIAQGEASLRKVLADYIWGFDDDTLEGIIRGLLIERSLTVATMESFTGGLLAHNLTNILEGSRYKGGFIACSQETKLALGVDARLIDGFGEVSPEVAEAMARAVRQRLEADIGIGITGGTGERTPSGLAYIAIWDGKGKWTRDWKFPPHHPEYKRYAASAALFGLRERLLALDM